MLTDLESALRLAGALQLLQLPVMSLSERYYGIRSDLQRLAPANRGLVSSLALGIIVYVTGTGLLALVHAEPMARTELGLGLCRLQAVAWVLRTTQELLVVRPHWPPKGRWLGSFRLGIYASLALLYSAAFGFSEIGPSTLD